MKSKGLEKILNILYKISLNPLGALGWRCVYACNYQAGKFWLRNFTGAQSVYLKGSYAKASWRPLISDIDFALVYEGSSGEEDAKKIAWLKKLLPIVRDIERFESKDFELRLKYGSYKYLDFSNWIKVSKGSPAFQTQRFSYPLKNLWDLVHELYFYVEWIQVNLNSSFNSYRQACARRALLKIAKLVAKFNDGFNWEGYLEQNPLESLETKEELLQWMFSCLEELGGAAFLVDKFLSSKDFDWNEILSRNYYQRRFQIVDVQNFKWNGEKNQLPFDLFKLFYSLGCIDSLVVYKFLSHTDDETLNSLVLIEYYQKIQDGKGNELHANVNDLELKERFKAALQVLSQCRVFNPANRLDNKTVFVTASWGNQYLKILGRSHKALNELFEEELAHVHVSLGGDDPFFESLKTLTTYKIEWDEEHEGLWHKESLYNFAKRICHGANIVVFSDIDVIIKDKNWLPALKNFLKDHEAVQPFSKFKDEETGKSTYSSLAALEARRDAFYAPGLMWGFNKKGLEKIGDFFDYFHDGSNDGVLFKHIAKVNIGFIEEFEWMQEEILKRMNHQEFSYGYVDFEVEHISHPSAKQYDNMIIFLNLLHRNLIECLERDSFKLWRWKKDAESQAFKKAFKSFLRDRGFISKEFHENVHKLNFSLLDYKTETTTAYLNEKKDIELTTKPRTLGYFIGQEISSASVFIESQEQPFEYQALWSLEPLEKDTTYCFNFLLNSSSKLDDKLSFKLLRCNSDDVEFKVYHLSKNLWAAAVVFYAFETFQKAQLAMICSGDSPLGFHVKDLAQDHCHMDLEVNWRWAGEFKDKTRTKAKIHKLLLKKRWGRKFRPQWYKLVIRLQGGGESYSALVKNDKDLLLCTERIQTKGDDYLSVFFRPASLSEELVLEISSYEATSFYHDIVWYISDKKNLSRTE